MQYTAKKINKGKRSRKRIILTIVIGAVVLLLAVGGIEVYRILCTPQDLFAISTIDPSKLATSTPALTPKPEDTDVPTTVTTTTPGITEGKEILNILLIGVDRREAANGADSKGTSKSAGTDPHADVQMIVAINFKENKVDLISIPRDTFIHNTELMNGVYKINATFNVGGSFTDSEAGFRKVCDGAEYMLGGIPVDYYYAVDFGALVKLVDAIGGVDFDVDSKSYSRQRKTGMQHMNGEDVLYYLRIRKTGPAPGDLNRINRQKDMMVAIFTQLKEKGQLSMVPDLINAAGSGVYTNTNLEQTLALANFAMNIDPKNIGMHSFTGPSADSLYLRWCFTDQEKRVGLIKEVYGVDVPEQTHCSEKYSDWLRKYGFSGMVYMKTAEILLNYADERKAGFTGEQKTAYDELKAALEETQEAWDLASLTLKDADTRVMLSGQRKLKSAAVELDKLLDYEEKLQWDYDHHYWWHELEINEKYVDVN